MEEERKSQWCCPICGKKTYPTYLQYEVRESIDYKGKVYYFTYEKADFECKKCKIKWEELNG